MSSFVRMITSFGSMSRLSFTLNEVKAISLLKVSLLSWRFGPIPLKIKLFQVPHMVQHIIISIQENSEFNWCLSCMLTWGKAVWTWIWILIRFQHDWQRDILGTGEKLFLLLRAGRALSCRIPFFPFACLINRIFSINLFFSHNKSTNNIFNHDFSDQQIGNAVLATSFLYALVAAKRSDHQTYPRNRFQLLTM